MNIGQAVNFTPSKNIAQASEEHQACLNVFQSERRVYSSLTKPVEIYQVLKQDVARCSDWTSVLKCLKSEGIDVRFNYMGNTNEVQVIIFTKNGYHFNGSKIDRSFSYSKIDKALNSHNQAEYQRQYEPHHMQINHFVNKESELISGSLGLLDFTSSLDADSQEEANFRRLIQQKPKKKRRRGFKL